MTSRRFWALGLALFVALAMRSFGLAGKSVWVDEAISGYYAQQSLPGVIREVARFDTHPPLFYFLCWVGHHLWPGVVGIRLPSFLAIGLLPIALYALARASEDERTAERAFLLACLSAYLTYFSQEARNYAVAGLWGCLCPLLLLRIKDSASPWRWLAWSLLCLICLYTYLYLALLLACLALWWVWERGLPRGRQGLLWVASHGVAGLLFLPWLPVILERAKLQATSSGWRPGFGFWDVVRLVNSFSVGPHEYLTQALPGWPLSGALFASLWAALALAGLVWSRNRRLWAVLLFGVPGLIWVLPVHLHLFDPKHVFFLLPFFILCQAKALSRISSFAVQGIAVGMLILFNLASFTWYQSSAFGKSCWDEATFLAEKGANRDDIAIFDPFYVGYAFDFYVPRDCSIRNRLGPGEKREEIVKEVAEAIQPWQRIWLFTSTGPVTQPCPELLEWLLKNRSLAEDFLFAPAGAQEQVHVFSFDAEPQP